MELQSFKFGNVIYENSDFMLCDVSTDIEGAEFIALVPTCLRLKKVIPSIPATVKSVSGQISNISDAKGVLTTIVDSGINHDLNPFLIIEKPIGMRLAVFRYSVIEQLLSIIRQLANCLLTLHEHQIFQRDLDPSWDIFYDGFRVCVAFPGARDIFHKAYIEADDGSTVFDVPRFVVKKGSVKEDVEALLRVADSMVEQARSSIQASQLDNLQNILNQNKLVLSHYSDTPELVLKELAKLSLTAQVVDLSSRTSNTENGSAIQETRGESRPSGRVKFRKFILLALIVIFVLVASIFFKSGPSVDLSEEVTNGRQVADDELAEMQDPISAEVVLDQEDVHVDPIEVDPEVMRTAKEEIETHGGKEVPLLKPTWTTENAPIVTKQSNSDALNSETKVSAAFLAEFENIQSQANSDSFEVRINAAKNLARYCDKLPNESSSIYERLLNDPDILVRGFAVHGYSDCRGADSKRLLESILKKEKSIVVREAIEKVLK